MTRSGIRLLVLLASAACSRHAEPPPPIDPEANPIEYLSEVALEARLGLFNSLLEFEAPDLVRLVDAENRLSSEAREELATLSAKSTAAARAVIEAHPDRVEGHLYLASNLGLAALSQGHAQSLMDGLPGKIRAAYERAIEIDRSFDSAGPLRVKGKFQLGAPWPIGSRDEAGKALKAAADLAPVPENLLWLGDFHSKEGNLQRATETWRAAIETTAKSASWQIDGRVRDLARLRLALAEGGTHR